MVKVRLYWVCVLLFAVWSKVSAQTAPGALDNYSGSAGAWLNPSSLSTTFVHDDVGLPALSFSLGNGFAYLPPGTLWPSLVKLVKDGTWAVFDGVQPDKEYYYLYYQNERFKQLYQSAELLLPSMMMTVGGRHALSFSVRQRFYTSATRMSWEIPVLITESLDYEAMHGIPYHSEGMRFASMAWSEAAVSYSTTVYDDGLLKVDAGVTGKLPLGAFGFAGRSDALHYQVVDGDNLFFDDFQGDLQMALPVSYKASFADPSSFSQLEKPFYKGVGVGFDVGASVTFRKEQRVLITPRSACDDAPTSYFWRAGVSLLDLGQVRFKNNLLAKHMSGTSFMVNTHDFDQAGSIMDVAEVLDQELAGQVSTLDMVTAFSIGLPTAVSLQFDANILGDLYCGAVWIQPVSRKLYGQAVEREPLLSVIPRYETSYFGVSVPLTLSCYRFATVGTFVRLGPLTFGTNDLLSLTSLGKTRALDFFVGLRLKLDRGSCLFDPLIDACGGKHRFNW